MRNLRIEKLENRLLLHADVNLDNVVTPADALAVINHLDNPGEFSRNLDVNRDARVSALDALVVINRIARDRDVTPARTITFSLGKINVNGLTEDEVNWAIREAMYEYEKIIDVNMKIVASGGAFTIASAPLYIGDSGFPFGSYARGLTNAIGGHTIRFSEGKLLANKHIGTLAPRNQDGLWLPFGHDPNRLKTIVQHELGHGPFSLSHAIRGANASNCVMHISANRHDFCESEQGVLVRAFGAAK